jgi:hypothetical protein
VKENGLNLVNPYQVNKEKERVAGVYENTGGRPDNAYKNILKRSLSETR